MDLITVTRRSGPVFDIRVRDHVLTSDLSGRSAASPAEMLAGALGACIAMIVQDRCDRQGHGDGDVRVDLTTELSGTPTRIARIVADLELPGDVPQEEFERVRRLAEHCVIGESFKHQIQVDMEIA